MPYCPICQCEYKAGVNECPDCKIELVDKLYQEKKSEFCCDNCKEDVSEKDKFCKNCGAVFESDFKCKNHPDVMADALCLICKNPYCSECIVEVEGKFFCEEHSKYNFNENNWAVIYTTNHDWDANIHKGYLDDMKIPCIIDSKKDTARMLTYGLLADIRVMVHFDYVLKAEEALKNIKKKK